MDENTKETCNSGETNHNGTDRFIVKNILFFIYCYYFIIKRVYQQQQVYPHFLFIQERYSLSYLLVMTQDMYISGYGIGGPG